MPEVLDWESGLSRCLSSLEEKLIRWNAEERKKALDRQLRASRAEEDLASVEAAVCQATPDSPKDEPWQDRLASLVRTAKEQRAELRDFCKLLRRRAPEEAPELLDDLPEDTVPEKTELQRLTSSFLESAARNASVEENEQEEDAPEDAAPDETEQDTKKEPKKTKKPAKKAEKREVGEKPKKRAKAVQEEKDDGEEELDDYSEDYDYSYSRTPSPKPKRRRRGGGGGGGGRRAPEKPRKRRQRRRPSRSAYSGDSYSPPPDRRPRGRGRRPRGRREDGGGSRDLASDIDRFVRVNKLEDRCEKILRDLEPRMAKQVMGLSGGNNTFELSGDVRDPTAVVLARVRKARDGGGRGGGRRGGGERRRRRSP